MKTSFVQAGPVRLQTFETGDGPNVIIFVHGYTASGRIWRMVQEALDPVRFRSIAISNRGAGDSDRSDREEDYFVETFAADLHTAVQALGVRDFTLVGHSMGGLTVTAYALEHQDVLRALVLIDPGSLDGRTRAGAPVANPATAPAQIVDELRAPADFLAALRADSDRNPPARLSAGRTSMERVRLREHLTELRLPVLVVAGDRDTLVGVPNILTEYLTLPPERRSLHVFHGVGHSPNISVPRELAALLAEFVEETVARMVGV